MAAIDLIKSKLKNQMVVGRITAAQNLYEIHKITEPVYGHQVAIETAKSIIAETPNLLKKEKLTFTLPDKETTAFGNGGGIAESLMSPVQTAFGLVGDFWSLLLGTWEQKNAALADVTGKVGITIPTDKIEEALKKQLGTQYGTQQYLINPLTGSQTEVETPDILGGIKNSLIWIIAIVAGVYIIGKFITRK